MWIEGLAQMRLAARSVGDDDTDARAVVAADGTWIGAGQLGDEVFGLEPGDGMRLVALVVDGAAPPPQLEVVTQRTVPDLVTVSGVLDARVR